MICGCFVYIISHRSDYFNKYLKYLCYAFRSIKLRVGNIKLNKFSFIQLPVTLRYSLDFFSGLQYNI